MSEPNSFSAVEQETVRTKPNDEYYGAWRENEDLVLFKLPGYEPFRLSNVAANRLFDDFAKIVGKKSRQIETHSTFKWPF